MAAVIALVIAGLIVACDQLTKFFVVEYLKPVGSFTAIPHILNFTYVENRGMAFGLFQNNRWIFIALTSAVILAAVVYLFVKKPKSRLLNLSVAFIIGGGIGNLIDRIILGYVIDFLSLSFFKPVCNVADYFITAGMIMFMVYLIFYSDFFTKKEEEVKADE